MVELDIKNLLNNAHIGVVIHSYDTSIVYANPTALKLMRLSYEQIIGKTSMDPQWQFVDEAGRKMLVEEFPVNKVKKTHDRLRNEVIGVVDGSNPEITWFMVNAYFEGVPEDPNSFIVVTFNDISDSKKLFSFEEIVENTQDMVVVTEADDIDGPIGPKIVYVNEAFKTITGYSSEEVIGETPRILQGKLTDKESCHRIHCALKKKEPVSETLLNYDKNGRPYWIEMNIIPLMNKYNKVTHFAAIERDVSESMFQQEQLTKRNQDLKHLKENLQQLVDTKTNELLKANAKLEKIAFIDPLTNIPNRRYFIDSLIKLMKSCNRRGLSMLFGIIDIDNFKTINDSFGHDTGDKVLKILSEYLSSFFRLDDTYCRYGGEEFAFGVAVNSKEDVSNLLDRLVEGIRALSVDNDSEPPIKITASVGAKFTEQIKKFDFDEELARADKELYQVKKSGKNNYAVEY